MTLLELLVKELPRRGGWPEDVFYVTQDYDGQVNSYGSRNPTIGGDTWTHQGFISYLFDDKEMELCEEWNKSIITREQYEAAIAAQQPVWDGEGLPPVGIEIEYKFTKVSYRSDFSRGKVLAYGIQSVFMEHWSSKNEFIHSLDHIEFRPIRTETDRKREDILKLMRQFVTKYNKTDVVHAIEELYEAIAAGKIPGVELSK